MENGSYSQNYTEINYTTSIRVLVTNIMATEWNYPWWSQFVFRKVMERERNADCTLYALSVFNNFHFRTF